MHHPGNSARKRPSASAQLQRSSGQHAVSPLIEILQVPLPLMSVADVMAQQAACYNSSSTSNTAPPSTASSTTATAAPPSLPVSLKGVITGVSAPAEVVHSQRFQCPACGVSNDVTPDQTALPCCGLTRHGWMQEDLTGRFVCATCTSVCVYG